MAPTGTPLGLWTALAFLLLLVLLGGLPRLRREEIGAVGPALLIVIVLALVGSGLYATAASWPPAVTMAAGAVAALAGLAALWLLTRADTRALEEPLVGYPVVLMPWLAAAARGILMAWLLRSWDRAESVVAADQALLATALVVSMAELLAFRRWRRALQQGAGEMHLHLEFWGLSVARWAEIRSWMGLVLPGLLLLLTITGEGRIWAWLAAPLLLGGDLLWYSLWILYQSDRGTGEAGDRPSDNSGE
jgi:hypothetical protein